MRTQVDTRLAFVLFLFAKVTGRWPGMLSIITLRINDPRMITGRQSSEGRTEHGVGDPDLGPPGGTRGPENLVGLLLVGLVNLTGR